MGRDREVDGRHGPAGTKASRRRLGLAVAGALLASACGGGTLDGGSQPPGTTAHAADASRQGASLPPPDEYGGVAPTDAARERVELLSLPRDDVRNCGVIAEDAGYPTTIAPWPDRFRCISDAFAAREPAAIVVTARDSQGGARVAVFTVSDGQLLVTRHRVKPDGTVATTESACEPPAGAWRQADSYGNVFVGEAPSCVM